MKDKYLDSMVDECKEIREISNEIAILARAFHITGNEVVADSLHNLSLDLHDCQEKINNAVSENLNDRLSESRNRVGETLKLVLDSALSE